MTKKIFENMEDFGNFSKGILDQEIRALQTIKERLDVRSMKVALDLIQDCQGIILVLGSGTSSSIARRMAHVLTCSGTRAIFLDPGQAQHGYSGIVQGQDLLISFSRGGETDEINHVLRIAKNRGAKIIGIMEQQESTMARLSDVVLAAPIDPENDAIGVLPLASTLVHAVIGDMLCAAVLQSRGYADDEFAALHPGGAVGKRLSNRQERTSQQQAITTMGNTSKIHASDSSSVVELSEVPRADLRDLQGLILDMDGVLWRGAEPLPGLKEFFAVLEQRKIRYVLATNNPSARPEGFAEKARSMGVEVDPASVITSVIATIHYLTKTFPIESRVHVIGQPSMKDQIAEAGFILADEDVVAVVVALDRNLTYETIKRGTLLIRSGAAFIGTNADPSYPSEEGIVPGSGMMVTALAVSSDQQPIIMGKPERAIFDLALERLDTPPERVASVGDRLETDIAGGQRIGLKTILVLGGVTQLEDLPNSPVQPDWIFKGIEELTSAFDERL